MERSYQTFKLGPRDEIVRQVSAALGRIGTEPRLDVTGGGTDANIFNAHGIAAAPVSVGYEKIHTVDEFIPIEQLVKSAQLVVELVRS